MLEIQTNRLVIREWRDDDWVVIYAMSREPRITRYQSWLRLEDEAHARRWVQAAIHHNNLVPRRAYNMAIVEKHSGTVIGWLGWGLAEESDRTVGFGYALQLAFWGCGYMTEAVQAMVAWVFRHANVDQVRSSCAASNVASARVIEKAGLQRVAVIEETDEDAGVTENQYYYTLTRESWLGG